MQPLACLLAHSFGYDAAASLSTGARPDQGTRLTSPVCEGTLAEATLCSVVPIAVLIPGTRRCQPSHPRCAGSAAAHWHGQPAGGGPQVRIAAGSYWDRYLLYFQLQCHTSASCILPAFLGTPPQKCLAVLEHVTRPTGQLPDVSPRGNSFIVEQHNLHCIITFVYVCSLSTACGPCNLLCVSCR